MGLYNRALNRPLMGPGPRALGAQWVTWMLVEVKGGQEESTLMHAPDPVLSPGI